MVDISNNPDATLLAAAQRGDPDAWRTIFETHFHSLTDYAASFLHSTEAAEDLVANIFARLIEQPASFIPQQTIRAYLLWLVHRRALNTLRDVKREQHRHATFAASQELVTYPSEHLPSHDLSPDLTSALNALSPTARSIVLLRLRQDLDYDEIASVMGMTRNAVKMQLSRALRALRERLQPPESPK